MKKYSVCLLLVVMGLCHLTVEASPQFGLPIPGADKLKMPEMPKVPGMDSMPGGDQLKKMTDGMPKAPGMDSIPGADKLKPPEGMPKAPGMDSLPGADKLKPPEGMSMLSMPSLPGK